MLQLSDVTAGYGNLQVLRGVNLMLRQGEVAALLGGNGVGKTTTLRTIVGLIRTWTGSVRLDGQGVERMPPHRIFSLGVSLVPQGRELFADMTVTENLELGGLARLSAGETGAEIDRVMGLFPRLRERAQQRAGSLSGGEQQMLATGRALMSRPRLLLLDEPTAGLAPKIVAEIGETIRTLSRSGQTILLVEQNVRLALSVADRVSVMRGGRIVEEREASGLVQQEDFVQSLIA